MASITKTLAVRSFHGNHDLAHERAIRIEAIRVTQKITSKEIKVDIDDPPCVCTAVLVDPNDESFKLQLDIRDWATAAALAPAKSVSLSLSF